MFASRDDSIKKSNPTFSSLLGGYSIRHDIPIWSIKKLRQTFNLVFVFKGYVVEYDDITNYTEVLYHFNFSKFCIQLYPFP
ncbi:MAG: hypothetical protein QXW79_00050 [Thermoplasmata archaeon]